MTRGIFFSFDGVDGAGKSTQMSLFCKWLEEQQRDVVICRDPGSSQLGETIRKLVLGLDGCAIGKRSELLLYMAARAQLVEEVIRPALEQGRTIVSDRFLLANVAYQAYAGGLDVGTAWNIGEFATDRISPDLTFVFDLPVEIAWSRLNRERDRMERRGPEFLERVRQGFLTEAAREPNRILLVDATHSIDAIQDEFRKGALPILATKKHQSIQTD